MKQILFLPMLLLLNAAFAAAEPMLESDIPVRYNTWHITYNVNADGSFTETQKLSATVLKENYLERQKTASVTFSTSVAKGEILEAYTLKKSGQRIDAPKDSYQVEINDGYNNASPLYSDETTITVVFPDLAVGDTTVFTSRVVNSEGMFPGQFSTVHHFSRYDAYDDVVVEIAAPASLELKRRSFFLTELPPVVRAGKQTFQWKYGNKKPEKWTPEDSGITTVGDDPSLFVSTFRSYREIAEAYGVRATPKAVVSDRVKKLASEIVTGKTAPEAQARAIYDWVSKNISYGGNCIGIGAVVPRDLNVVLDNKMGDCKDHATLLQALLAARNIESEQALINAGGLYQLPGVPVVSAVNHVINYIPKWNLYADTTSSLIPFGLLPMTLGEKPVLLVSHYREGQKTPSSAQQGHEQIMKTILRINPDGSAIGDMDLRLKGHPAIAARALMRLLPREREEFMVKKMLEAQGAHGDAVLRKDDPKDLLDTYNMGLSFKLDDYVTVGGTVGIPIRPVAGTILPIEGFMGEAYELTPKKPQPCGGGVSIEEYVLEFPSTSKIVGIPKDVALSTAYIDYMATYRKSANTITIRRELRDKTPSNVCSPEYVAGYKQVLLNIARDLKSQVLLSE